MVGIKITDKALKMSGRYTLWVKFDYDKRIKDLLESYPCYYRHKKNDMYEFPLCDLANLLDDLCKITDIELQMNDDYEYNENEPISNQTVSDTTNDLESYENSQLGLKIAPKSPLTQDEIHNFKEKPFAHQIEAINFGLEKEKFLLLDGCGLGKTNEIIWLAETLKARGLLDHCLIICGVNSLKQNWKKEIAKFSNLTCRVLGERITRNGTIRYSTVAERRAELMGEFEDFFVITNVEVFRSNKTKKGDTMVDALKKSKTRFGMIAIDEIHKCLTGDTIVLTEDGEKTIEQLYKSSTSSKILSFNVKKNQNEFKLIKNIIRSNPTENILELKFDNGKTIKCTESHKIFTLNRGWVEAKNLLESDEVKVS